jgi:hypothetical protein
MADEQNMATDATDMPTAQTMPDYLQQGEAPVDDSRKKINSRLRNQVDLCRQYRKKLIRDWQLNVDYRRGKPFASSSDEDRIAVNMDWALTKQKQSSLFSQVPAVRVNHPPQTVADDVLPWIHGYEQRINDTVVTAGIESAMDEVLPDCINAAGVGVVLVSRETLSDEVEVPQTDLSIYPPQLQQEVLQSKMLPDGTPLEMVKVPRVIDSRYVVIRVSPADFLWPLSFTGSDFDNAPWVGRSGEVYWAEAVHRFGLTDAQKRQAIGGRRPADERIDKMEPETSTSVSDDLVSFNEIFVKEHYFDPTVKSFASIRHLVFIDGIKEPVIDDPWEGQKLDPQSGLLLGALKYPLRVLTLTYITDDAIPPSDSAIGRPQTNELNKSRTQLNKQREHSLPIRWFDVNRVDPAIQYTLMRGTWQGMIPVQGQGTNIIGEVARAHMGQDNYAIDRIVKNDLSEVWQAGAASMAADIETKAEAQAVNAPMQTRIARERAKVGKFFVGITEVLGGLLSIFEDPASFGQGFTPLVSRTLSYSILADSTVLLDSNQRLQRLINFLNFAVKSGFVDAEPVLKEIATLVGLDPAVVIRKPMPKPPVEPNISLRLTGTEDLLNPLVLAFLINSGQAPSPDKIEMAKQIIQASVAPPQSPQTQPVPPDGGPGDPNDPTGGPGGPGGAPMLPGAMPPLPPLNLPVPPPAGVGGAHPEWSAMDRINSRVVTRD